MTPEQFSSRQVAGEHAQQAPDLVEFEWASMLERRREGIGKADGNYPGRVPTARRKVDEVRRPKADGLKLTGIVVRLAACRT